MEVQVVTRNVNITDDIKSYAENKINRLSKYVNNITAAKIELSEERSKSRQHCFTAQVTLNVNGFLIRGEQKAEDVKASIDKVEEVMERLISKFKKRYEINKGRTPKSIKQPENIGIDVEKETVLSNAVVKSKRFAIKPMTIEQAIDQMEFLGHDFFLFLDVNDNVINVVYRRKDGRYSLIQPEIA